MKILLFNILLFCAILVHLKVTALLTAPCHPEQHYTCKSSVCIPKHWVCDGSADCQGGDDEHNCNDSSKCAPDYFQCDKDRICVPNSFRCDGESDCPNMQDEENCENVAPCPTDNFRCGNGRCLPSSYRCNGKPECADGEDEKGCAHATTLQSSTNTPTTPTPSKWATCKSGNFVCDGGCVKIDALCNSTTECQDGADEIGCNVLASRLQMSSSSSLIPKPLFIVFCLTKLFSVIFF